MFRIRESPHSSRTFGAVCARPPSSFCQPLIGWRGGRRRLETKRVDRIGCHPSSVRSFVRSVIADRRTDGSHRVISPHHISCSCIHPSSPIHPFFPAIYRTFEPIIIISQGGEGGEGETGLAYARSLFRRKINSTPSFDASQEWKSIIITADAAAVFSVVAAFCNHSWLLLVRARAMSPNHDFIVRVQTSVAAVGARARRACVPPAHGIEGEGGRRCGRVTIERSFDVMAPPPFLPRKLRLYCA